MFQKYRTGDRVLETLTSVKIWFSGGLNSHDILYEIPCYIETQYSKTRKDRTDLLETPVLEET